MFKYKHPLYKTWNGMKARCYNRKRKDFHIYGGRGITVCDEWLADFWVFAQWAREHGYFPGCGLMLERIDNNGPYCPDNCKYATPIEQASNRRTNHLVTAFGETKSIANWARDHRCMVSRYTLRIRIVRLGLKPEIAITHPPQPFVRLGNRHLRAPISNH